MTDKQKSEVRATAAALETLDMGGVADLVRRQYAELETLRTGYAAARLEIESLRKEHADELAVAYMCGASREKELAAQQVAAYAAQDSEHQLAIMEGERNASLDAYSRVVSITSAESRLYERAFTSGWDRRDRLASYGQVPAQAAPAAVAGSSEFPHEKMDAVALGRYKVVSSDQSMFYRFAVVAGDGAQQLYIGREVDCQNMARKFAGAFLDGAFAYHSMTAAPTTQPAPRQEAQEPFAWHVCSVNSDGSLSLEHAAAWEEAAREHINDAITEHDIEGAGSWVVRPAYHAPQPAPQQEARPVTPYTCPKCSALWLYWPAEQSGFGRDTLNCRNTTHCDYCEKGGVEQLQRLERVPAVLAAPQPSPAAQGDALDAARYRAIRDCSIDERNRFEHYSGPALDAVLDKYNEFNAAQDKALKEVVGCFEAAEAEGLQEVLAETTDERLKDLVERRLMYALYAARAAQGGTKA